MSRTERALPPSTLYDRDYFLSRACDGLGEYLAGGLSSVRARELGHLELEPGHRVLDLGCGRGESSREMIRRGAQVTALDYSADAVALTRHLTEGRANTVTASGSHLPFADASFDRVLMGDVVEHLPWSAGVEMLKEVRRVLAPGGLAVIHTSPNVWFIRVVKPPLQLMLRVMRWHEALDRFAEYDRLRADMHPNELSPRALPRLLSAAGVHGRTWVDRNVLRSGQSEWTAQLGTGRVRRLVGAVAGLWPLRLVLGNDLYAAFGAD